MGEEIVNIYYEFKLRQIFFETADNIGNKVTDVYTWN